MNISKTSPPKYIDGPFKGSNVLTVEHQDVKLITIEEIRADFPNVLLSLNEKSCITYLEKYKHKRNHFLKEVNRRLQDIRRAKRISRQIEKQSAKEQSRQERRELAYLTFKGKLHELLLFLRISAHDYINSQLMPGTIEHTAKIRAVSRVIGEIIHGLGNNDSGLMTLNAYKVSLNQAQGKLVWDHYYPRSRAGGEDIFLHCVTSIEATGNYDLRDLLPAACSGSEVIRTTQEENNKILTPHQKRETFISPSVTFQQANIPVVRIQIPKYHHHWIRLSEEIGKALPPFHEFPQEISKEQAELIIREETTCRSNSIS